MSNYENNLNQKWSEEDTFTIDRYKQFSKFIKDGNSVLDIGCNTGRGRDVLKYIYPNLNLFGIDLVRERIDKIPSGIYHELFNDSIVSANCSGNKFDVIVGGEIIEHIPEFLFKEMLLNCNSMLNNNGIMIFTTPNPNSILVKLGRTKVLNDPSHVNILSISKIKQILFSYNFKIRQIEGSGKASRYIGFSFPINFYGSYLIIVQKNQIEK